MEDIDVVRTINCICKHLGVEKIPVSEFVSKQLQLLLSKQIWTPSDRHQMLDVLSVLLLEDHFTLIIAENFSPLLLELLSHAATSSGKVNRDFTRHELIGVALGKLVGRYPVASRFCTQYFETHPSILECLIIDDGEPCTKKQRKALGHQHWPDQWRLFIDSSKVSLKAVLLHNGNEFSSIHVAHAADMKKTYGNMKLLLEKIQYEKYNWNICGDLKDNIVEDNHLKKLLQAAFQLLIHNCHFFRKKWNWATLVDFIGYKQADIRWLAFQCISIVTGMSGASQQSLMQYFSEKEMLDLRLKYTDILQPLWKTKYVTYVDKQEQFNRKTHSKSHFIQSDLCENIVSISGVLIDSIKSKKIEQSKNMVIVPCVKSTLRSLALAVSAGNCILLQGPVGCGKTALVEHLAAQTGRIVPPHLIKLQLGDQMDSKLLLGSYCCTDIPGEFIWHAGPLTQAMTSGYWLLLEDIDYAPMDIISLLVPVLHSRSIILPGHAEPVKAASGFRLFATQRLLASHEGMHSEFRSHADILSKLWRKIAIQPMSRSELEEVITTKWPVLKPVSCRILDIYFMITSGGQQAGSQNIAVKKSFAGGRLISTRDLLKWCQRISMDFDIKSVERAVATFQDALDSFCRSIPTPTYRLSVAKCIGTALNLTDAKVEYYCDKHKPDITVSADFLKIGRVILQRNEEETAVIKRCQMTFAHTRQAVSLLESVAVAVKNQEPVLLVGETGTGKTSIVQYLANLLGHKLTVINMNQQSDSVDLLGGYKPVELKFILSPLHEEFEELFNYTFSRSQNMKFLGHVVRCFTSHRWHDLLKIMIHIQKVAVKKKNSDRELLQRWNLLGNKIHKMQTRMEHIKNTLAFSFIEGSLVNAIRKGEWILLDEINLAEAETLECLGGLLESSSGSVLLAERGDRDPVKRHPNFCLFACMNPATDVGKKDLPPGIRNRFTEFFMDELEDKTDLQLLVDTYLKGLSLSAETLKRIVQFYIHIKKEANTMLSDGTGHRPHYSLRTLCRALSYAARNTCGSVPRSLFEAFCLSFLTQLDRSSHPLVTKQIAKHLLEKNQLSVLKQPLPEPVNGKYICFEGYWILKGLKESTIPQNYILTPSVRQNLRDLVRVVSAGKQPILIQGETSVGKTSLIQWLAAASGNHCVRVNNHEHTDLQEYLGSYSADDDGKLTFKEGILVEAMVNGHWIILDELNLAPTEVLEALNRVLDDNREIYIPEVQQAIKAHPQFMLFATQNPPGIYGGRKVLSRAFRNRFVELHFDEIPPVELETILHERCAVPPSYCKKLVGVMLELQMRRRESGIFAGKSSYITLRDLFRWGERYRLASEHTEKFYDWNEHLANEGYILLAGRVRKQKEADIIQEVIERQMKCRINPHQLFTTGKGLKCSLSNVLEGLLTESLPKEFLHIVWTYNMKRLAVLVGQAMKFNEPILLVGDTGQGKTTICQLFATQTKRELFCVNCHMHSESSDFLGGLRPVRHTQAEMENKKLFEWVDGPLVTSMKLGTIFLADEISLADDSVLERLNSILEPERTVLLAEKTGSGNEYEGTIVVAKKGFQFMATMNPGGDFGKKELSPALRNRFTEIWCPPTNDRQDLIDIIKHNIQSSMLTEKMKDYFSKAMVEFSEWFRSKINTRCTSSIRDMLTWVNFINYTTSKKSCDFPLSLPNAYIHGACLVYLDSLGSGMTCLNSTEDVRRAHDHGMKYLTVQMKPLCDASSQLMNVTDQHTDSLGVVYDEKNFGIHPFYIRLGPDTHCSLEGTYTLASPMPHANALRLLRAMQLAKPILLEGIPGVGKTSLVTSIAKASGNKIVRINLSEQTDISDLFGADLPIEGKCGEFAWRDGPLLQALKSGCWILLDELNLASQSVLEGLNACLDHRGEIFVPELGKSFQVQHKKTWIFGCQNPHKQGGARKGLPKSFLNRFTQVYVEQMSSVDLVFISHAMYSLIPKEIISKMAEFNQKLADTVLIERLWGQKGSPWEFNLRDIFRWCDVLLHNQHKESLNPGEYVELIYADRMRTVADKTEVVQLYKKTFEVQSLSSNKAPVQLRVTEDYVQVGYSFLNREKSFPNAIPLYPLHCQMKPLQSLMKCIEMKWMAILVGSSVGKTSLVNLLASLTGHCLLVLTVSSEMDTTELLGGFEQADLTHHLDHVSQQVEAITRNVLWSLLLSTEQSKAQASYLLESWFLYHQLREQPLPSELNEEVECFRKRIDGLMTIIEYLASSLLPTELIQELASAKNELQRIEQLLKSFGVVSSGGRFEWVDSMLVTAVKKGYWLLIDDVNFCSPSVLDRLNGLLEQNGVLSISEQGVIGEEVPVIEPHPNFRLILAMDPKNGEISRAMRNRGVEIYISGEDEGCDPAYLDICRLMHSKGLYDPLIIDRLLRIHKHISEESKGIEKPTLLDLLQAASICGQCMHHGSLSKNALQESCYSVYAKNILTHSHRKEVEHIVEMEIAKFPDKQNNNEPFIKSISSLMPSSLDIHMDAELALLKQDSILFYCMLYDIITDSGKASDSKTNEYEIPFTATLPLSFNSIDSRNKMYFLTTIVRLFMETSTTNDWELRKTSMCQITSNLLKQSNEDSFKDVIHCLNEFIFKFLSNIPRLPIMQQLTSYVKQLVLNSGSVQVFISSGDTLLDLRWNIPLLKKLLSVEENYSNDFLMHMQSAANRFTLLLYYHSLKFIESCSILKPKSKKKQTSLLELARKYNDKEIMINDLPHPVIQHLLAFLSLLNEEMLYLLGEQKLICHTEEISKFQEVMQQCHQFANICKELHENYSIQLSIFALHWTWMEKKVFPFLCQFPKSKASTSLAIIVSNVKKELNITISDIHKLRPKVAELLGYPLPFHTLEGAMIFHDVQRLSKAVNVKKFIDNSSSINQLLSLYTLGPFFTEVLLSVLCALYSSTSETSFKEVRESVNNIGEAMIQKGLVKGNEMIDELDCQENNITLQELESHIQFLPLVDYLYVLTKQEVLYSVLKRTAYKLHPKYLQREENIDDHAFYKLQLLHEIEKQSIFLPPNYFNAFLLSESLEEKSNIPEYFANFFTHLQQSSSSSCVTNYLTWKLKKVASKEFENNHHSIDDKETVSLWQQNDLWAQQVPLRTFICMTLQGSLKSLSITLGNCFEKSKQLSMVNQILWKNMFEFSNYSNSFRSISAHIVQLWFNSVLCCLLSVIPQKDNQETNSLEDLYQLVSHIELPAEIHNVLLKAINSIKKLHDATMIYGEHNEASLSWLLGESWIYVGLFTMELLAPRDIIDPVQKWKLKLQYCMSQLENITMELNLRNIQCQILTGHSLLPTNDLHPLVKDRMKEQVRIEERIAKLKNKIAYRPSNSQFHDLQNDVYHYLTTVGSPEKVYNLLKQIEHYNIYQTVTIDEKKTGIDNLLQEIDKWSTSQNSFVDKIQNKHLLYGDLIIPFIAGIKQMTFGMQIAKHFIASSEFKSHISGKNFLAVEHLIINLIKFPFISIWSGKESSLSHFVSKPDTLILLENILSIASDGKATHIHQTVIKLVMSALLELRNEILVAGSFSIQNLFKTMDELLQLLANLWQEQNSNQKEKEEEEECLYQYRVHHHKGELLEENQDELEIAELFPTYHNEFDDGSLNSSSLSKEDNFSFSNCNFSSVFCEQDMIDIWSIHTNIVFRLSNTISSSLICRLHSLGCYNVAETDYISSFMLRYEVVQYLMQTVGHNLDSMLDHHTVGSNLLATYGIQKYFCISDMQGENPRHYDIYHMPNPSESVQCHQLLGNLTKRIHLLLEQFPEHPILKQILFITDRIMNFPINVPLMKFITGLEMILSVSQEWEVNSHKGVSLMKELSSITEIIIRWRKLELRCWSHCLDTVFNKQYSNCAKWWLYLYQLIVPLINQNQKADDDKCKEDIRMKLPGTLFTFFEHSTLGEFRARLDLIYTFLEHTKHLPASSEKSYVYSILYNVYQFFYQFLPPVTDKISLERKPIEKEVKDYIKIVRWSDINFWAVKQTVEKSHHTIHKHMKQFEKILKQPAKIHLVLQEKSETDQESNLWEFKCVLDEFVSPLSLQDYIEEITVHENSNVTKRKYKKMTFLCKGIFENLQLPNQINYLNDFAGNIISAAKELSSLDISKDANAEKRKKEARHIHVRKQKALSNLFKELSASGLSYKLGLILVKDISTENIMTLPPIDINELLVASGTSRMTDSVWKNCQDGLQYFYKSVAKYNVMSSALESPSKELNPSDIERCRGFIGHLMHLVIHQRHHLHSNSHSLLKMRMLLTNMQTLAKNKYPENKLFLPPQSFLEKWMMSIQQLSVQIITGLEQFIVILECCPQQTDDSVFISEPLDTLPQLIYANKDSPIWNEILGKAKSILELAKDVVHQLPKKSSSVLWLHEDYIAIQSAFEQLLTIAEFVGMLKKSAESGSRQNCLTDTLSFIVDEIGNLKLAFEVEISHLELNRQEFVQCERQNFLTKSMAFSITKLCKQFLLATQKQYLNCIKDKQILNENDSYEVMDKFITNEILNKFNISLENMFLAKVEKSSKKVEKLMKMIDSAEIEADEIRKIVSSALPFFDQYVNLMQFLTIIQTASHRTLCKLLYILIGIFTELSQKGFCLPPELQEEILEKEGAIQFKDIEDGGLGDGEGTKDVSEKLENEDQLDEAHKPEDYKKEKEDISEQPDIEEEEQGIETSDDFDGKLHDLKKDSNASEESSDDENENNLDKKMGDVNDDDDEKLDDELWGTDNESDNEEMKDDDKAEGKPQSDSTIVAKDPSKEKSYDREKESKDDEINETKSPEAHDLEEYDGENLNKPDNIEEAPDMPDLPEDLQLDKDDKDSCDESMHEVDEPEEKNKEDEIGDEEQIGDEDEIGGEVNEKNTFDNDEAKEENKDQEKNEECCQEYNLEDKETVAEENKTEEASVSSKDNTTTDEVFSSDHIDKVYCTDVIQTAEDAVEKFGMGEQNSTEEQHGQGSADCNKNAESEGQKGKVISSITNIMEIEKGKKQQKQQSKVTHEERTLGSVDADVLHVETVDSSEIEAESSNNHHKSNMYEHIRDSSLPYDSQAADTATEQQLRDQKPFDNDKKAEDMDIPLEELEELEDRTIKNVTSVKSFPAVEKKQKSLSSETGHEEMEVDMPSDATDEPPLTMTASRGPHSSIHTQLEYLQSSSTVNFTEHFEHYIKLTSSTELSERLWHEHTTIVAPLVQELCEQLRLVLEPTKMSKLKGDYRTGKRLNMRKVIPYIASQFRKDKIWLRRTKPSKREYQIMLAVDDSSSMADNKSKQLAFQSLALLGKSLSLLEAGEISVVKFGEDVSLLHPFGEPFTDQSGAQILQEFTFAQGKTRIMQLLNSAASMMIEAQCGPVSRLVSRETAQLLIIISDGRGIFNEGEECVKRAVHYVRNNNIFLVFLILDNPENKDSILDIRVPIFKAPDLIEIHPYMAKFPFPFYIILRDINSMPLVLGEALRQWFELITTTEH